MSPRRHGDEERGWWSRNWGWCLPLSGCLGCLGVIAIVFGLGVGGLALITRAAGEPIEIAMERAAEHPAVRESTGLPLEMSWANRSIRLDNEDGYQVTRAAFGVSGPDGSGRIRMIAERIDETWKLTELDFRPSGGDWVDLLEDEPSPQDPG